MGWLVDDDEEEEVVTPIEEREGLEGFPFPLPADPASKGKRKAVEQEKPKKDNGTKVKKRKVEVALIPYTKGPCWESHIGDSEFSQYRIHLFNGNTSSIPLRLLLIALCSYRYPIPNQPIHVRLTAPRSF